MERVTPRRVRRLEIAATDAQPRQLAAWLTQRLGISEAETLASLRRTDRRLRALRARLGDASAAVRAFRAEMGGDFDAVEPEVEALAAEWQAARRPLWADP